MVFAMRRYFSRALAINVLALIGLGGVVQPAAARPQPSVQARFDALIAEAKVDFDSNLAKAVETTKVAEALAGQAAPEDRARLAATAEWVQGEAYLRMNDTGRAAAIIDHAIALVSTTGRVTKLNGDLLLSRGGLDSAHADVAGALAAYQHAHKIFEAIGETRSKVIAILYIGLLYQEASDYQNALKYYNQASEVGLSDDKVLLSIFINKGVSLQELGRYAEALAQFRKALEIAGRMHAKLVEAQILRNIARGQLLTRQADAADRTIAQGFAVSRGVEAASARNHFLVLSAWSARLHGRLGDADRLIARAFDGIDPNKSTLDLREGHQIAYDIYKQAGLQSQALKHLEALKTLDDKTSTLAASANTALAAAQFDSANQELKIEQLKRAQLQRNIDDAKLRARTQQTIFGGLAVATLVIVALLAFGLVTIRRSRNQVRAANVDLAQTNTALGKALAAKTEFLATTSHEIRTPLNGILGMTQVMLADTTLTSALRDRIGVVHGAGVTMRALVDDILDVAKMETGNLTIERVPFDLKATLRDVSRMWEEQAKGKGLAFLLDLDDCPAFIEGDPARLRQIAFNLLSNALKFTATGRVSVIASASDARLTIAVRDTGIGIPADKLGIIFESFRQVDAGTTRQFGGTGLGLAICQNLARAMDGDVTVTSRVGEGSTFTLDLPLLRAVAPAAVAADAAEAPSALLILDRNPIARSMLRAVLETRAGSIVFASNADEALAKIAEGGIARVLIDEATIKAAEDSDAALLALGRSAAVSALLWASPDETDRARFAALGIDRVIAKPIAGAALAAAVFDDHNTPFHLVVQAA
jgi:signal transduction histidine kinase